MNKITYFGDGQSMDFAFSFNFFQTSDIYVEINGIPQTSGYTLTCINSTTPADIPYVGGTITFDTAPKSTDCIKIYRKIEMSRVVDYQPMVKLDPDTLNQDANYLMEVIKDRKDEIDELHEQYSDIADKESTSVLLARIDALNQQIENLERDIQNGKVMSKDDFYSYTTNCITEIPQDIKLELKDGVLTLKAGSKLYVPNGAGVFDVITTTQDCSVSGSIGANNIKVFIAYKNNAIISRSFSSSVSGAGATTSGGFAFDTTANKISFYNASGVLQSADWSFPIAIVSTDSSGAASNIDQVFNGFGYIGSTIFALPGVKGQIPNGRNDNGTLKNRMFTIESVLLKTLAGTATDKTIVVKSTDIGTADVIYNPVTNYNSYSSYCICGKTSLSNGQINSFSPKTVFSYIN